MPYLLFFGAVGLGLAVLAGLCGGGRQRLAGSRLDLGRCGHAHFGRRGEEGWFAVADDCAHHLASYGILIIQIDITCYYILKLAAISMVTVPEPCARQAELRLLPSGRRPAWVAAAVGEEGDPGQRRWAPGAAALQGEGVWAPEGVKGRGQRAAG